MNPKRFAESSCLKCHHEVVDLEASERFPDPPAPKLLAGYDLIRNYGCFGCHEINGFDGPNRRGLAPTCGPSRITPPRPRPCWPPASSKANSVDLAETLVQHPDDDKARHTLVAADPLSGHRGFG